MNKLLHTFPTNKPDITIAKAVGSKIITTSSREIYDITGGQTSHCIIGWANEEVNNAIKKQIDLYSHIDYKSFIDPNREKLSDILLDSNKLGMSKVYFAGNSGGEACEAAMKLSYQIHQKYSNKKVKFISRKQSYHGSTTETMSLGDRPNLEFYRPLFPTNKIYVSEHNFFRNAKEGELELDYLKRSISELEEYIIKNDPETISAFVAETMTGGLSGYVPPVAGYWKEVRELLNKYNIHLIVDEVIVGTGTSGKYHCLEYDQITPDFLFVGKTLSSGYAPISAVIISELMSKELETLERIQHSTTHQGHSLGVAAAIAVQSIVKDNLECVYAQGGLIQNQIRNNLLESKFFRNVRGRGYRFAIEYSCPDMDGFGRQLTNEMFYLEDTLIDAKWHRITFSPMLNSDFGELSDRIEKVCKKFIQLERRWHTEGNSKKMASDPQSRSF